jgi:hypothetical protein
MLSGAFGTIVKETKNFKLKITLFRLLKS